MVVHSPLTQLLEVTFSGQTSWWHQVILWERGYQSMCWWALYLSLWLCVLAKMSLSQLQCLHSNMCNLRLDVFYNLHFFPCWWSSAFFMYLSTFKFPFLWMIVRVYHPLCASSFCISWLYSGSGFLKEFDFFDQILSALVLISSRLFEEAPFLFLLKFCSLSRFFAVI